jgi:uroporphyrin-3 C-methyltransferase
LAADEPRNGQDELDPLAFGDERDTTVDRPAPSTDTRASDTEEPPSVPPRVRSGRGLAAFALLIALGAAAGVGYLYWATVYRPPENPEAGRYRGLAIELETLQARHGELVRELESSRGALASSIAELDNRQSERVREIEGRVAQSLGAMANAAPPSEREWQLAEVEYLLRIANHRVLMEQDFDTARELLEACDATLRELDDFSLHGVRAEIADEIEALSRVEGTDVQGLYLKLEALKHDLRSLALATPEFGLAPAAQDTAEDATFWEALAARFSELLQFRRVDRRVTPLLAPEEAVYLELNLRLALEQAQLAALRRDQTAFDTSLASAALWVDSHLDAEDPAVAALASSIETLRGHQLAVDVPDISGSLNEILRLRRDRD